MASRLGQMGSSSRDRARPRQDADAGANLRGLETWLSGLAKDLARCGEETPQRVADAILRLNERLDQLIDSGRTAAGEFERRVAAVDHALDDLNGESEGFARDRRPDPAANAVDEIRSRQRALDDVARDDADQDIDPPAGKSARSGGWQMPDLDRQLNVLSRQLDMMRRPCAFDESVTALRQDLGRIGDLLSKAHAPVRARSLGIEGPFAHGSRRPRPRSRRRQPAPCR